MKVDQDIIEQAFKEGMPQKPMRENFTSEEAFEESYGYWMGHYGRVLALRQQIRNEEKRRSLMKTNKGLN